MFKPIIFSTTLFVLFSSLLLSEPVEATDTYNYSTKDELAALYTDKIINSNGTDIISFDEAPSLTTPYSEGKVSNETQEYALNTLNYIRYIAHLPSVTINETYTSYAQHGAVLLDANQSLTHFPSQPDDMPDDFYKSAFTGTLRSNIAQGYDTFSQSIQGMIEDITSYENLLTVGHRRYLLNPKMGETGFGVSTTNFSYYVVYAFDTSADYQDYDFISWPAAGNHPVEYYSTKSPWSVTLNPDHYQTPNADNITVTLTRLSDNYEWVLSQANYTDSPRISQGYFTVNNQGYGVNNCIIFHPGTNTAFGTDELSGDYKVSIEGLKTVSGQDTTLTYTTSFFSLDDYVSESPVYYLTFETNGGDTISTVAGYEGKAIDLSSYTPSREGYTFEGWYTDKSLTSKITSLTLTDNITLYAKWQVSSYALTFQTNGGTQIDTVRIAEGKSVNLSAYTTTREGYSFDGWYSNEELTSRVDSLIMTKDMTLYAKWTALPSLDKTHYNAYIDGYSDNTVKPENKITREEIAQIFYNLLTEESREFYAAKENPFSDLVSEWSYTAITTLANAEILDGYPDGTFAPEKEITRAEFVKIVTSIETMTDSIEFKSQASDISGHWAEEFILYAYDQGWVSGYEDGTFLPQNSISRAEVIKITNVVLGRESSDIYLIENMLIWPDNPSSAWYYTDVQIATNSYTKGN